MLRRDLRRRDTGVIKCQVAWDLGRGQQWRQTRATFVMHVCLLPAEILLDIFAIIHEDYNSVISHATLAALARTCRTFKEPALDTLWKHIDGFEPLILCFPEGVHDRDVLGLGKLVSLTFSITMQVDI